MIIINKNILEAHATCAESLHEFVNVLGGGDVNFEIEFQDALTHIKQLPLDTETKASWILYVKALKDSPDFYLMQGAAVMNNKFHVFNPITGQHEEAVSIEDARILRQQIIDQFLQANIAQFKIGQEVFVPEENKSLWKVVE